jgi:hypothetical protein
VKYRPELTIEVIPTRPSGLAVITGLNQNSKLLPEKFDQIVEEFRNYELGYNILDVSLCRPKEDGIFNKIQKASHGDLVELLCQYYENYTTGGHQSLTRVDLEKTLR